MSKKRIIFPGAHGPRIELDIRPNFDNSVVNSASAADEIRAKRAARRKKKATRK
jgi:hypothetical protein